MMNYASQTEAVILAQTVYLTETFDAQTAQQWEALDFRRYQATGSLQSEGKAQGDVHVGIREERSEEGKQGEHENQETGSTRVDPREDAEEKEE
jgi:hypothetical protein